MSLNLKKIWKYPGKNIAYEKLHLEPSTVEEKRVQVHSLDISCLLK